MRDRKLIELMDEVAIAVGMADQMEDPGTQRVLRFHLNNAQRFLYEKTSDPALIYTFLLTCVVGQRYYDYPTLVHTISEGATTETFTDSPNPDELLYVTLVRGTDQYIPLSRGIDPMLYNQPDNNQPWRYECRRQLEIFPAPDLAYPIQMQGRVAIRRFKDEDDRCTVDGDLMVLLAAGAIKGNIQLPDSAGYAQMATSILRSRNAKAHGLTRYIPGPAVPTATSPLSADQTPTPPQPRALNWNDL